MLPYNFFVFFLQQSLILESFILKYLTLLFDFFQLFLGSVEFLPKLRSHWCQLDTFILLFQYTANSFLILLQFLQFILQNLYLGLCAGNILIIINVFQLSLFVGDRALKLGDFSRLFGDHSFFYFNLFWLVLVVNIDTIFPLSRKPKYTLELLNEIESLFKSILGFTLELLNEIESLFFETFILSD